MFSKHALWAIAALASLSAWDSAYGQTDWLKERTSLVSIATYCPDTSVSVNTITCATTQPFLLGYVVGQSVDVLLANTVSGATTINVNGLGAKAVTYNGTTVMASGVMVAGGTYRLTYDATRFVLQGSITAAGSGCTTSGSSGQVLTDNGAGGCTSQSGVTISGTNLTLGAAGVLTAPGGVSTGTSPPSLVAGTGGADGYGEGTVPGTCKAAGVDCLYADSTQHGFLASFNNGSYLPLIQGPASSAVNNFALFNSTTGGLLKDAGFSVIASGQMATVNVRRTCDIGIGDTSGSAITNAQLGPQKRVCFIPAASVLVEIDVSADAGTPNVIVGRNVAGTQLNVVSSALATASSGGIACSNTGGTTGIDGATTCSATLQNTALAAGSYLELVSGTAGGTAKWMTVHAVYTIN